MSPEEFERRLLILERDSALMRAALVLALRKGKPTAAKPKSEPKPEAQGDPSDPRDLGVCASDGVSAQDIFGRE